MTKEESRETRSRIMSSVKSRNTKIEKIVRDILVSLNVDMEEHPGDLHGKPDFILRSKMVAIFCDGDFWHGYEIDSNPRLNVRRNRDFWLEKIGGNIKRDKEVNVRLKEEGWRVVRLWEHDIIANPKKCTEIIKAAMSGGQA